MPKSLVFVIFFSTLPFLGIFFVPQTRPQRTCFGRPNPFISACSNWSRVRKGFITPSWIYAMERQWTWKCFFSRNCLQSFCFPLTAWIIELSVVNVMVAWKLAGWKIHHSWTWNFSWNIFSHHWSLSTSVKREFSSWPMINSCWMKNRKPLFTIINGSTLTMVTSLTIHDTVTTPTTPRFLFSTIIKNTHIWWY